MFFPDCILYTWSCILNCTIITRTSCIHRYTGYFWALCVRQLLHHHYISRVHNRFSSVTILTSAAFCSFRLGVCTLFLFPPIILFPNSLKYYFLPIIPYYSSPGWKPASCRGKLAVGLASILRFPHAGLKLWEIEFGSRETNTMNARSHYK